MSISMFKPSTYACLWPIEFCQIVVTLGRIYSCFHDRDHVHAHIHANSYTKIYTKHVTHPPKINTPKLKEISLLVILQRREGSSKKREYMLKKHRKNMLRSKSIEKKEKKKAWPPSKIKARGESQSKECLEIHKNIPQTCTSRSSCMTSFFLDPVFGKTISCGTSESHTYPTQSSTYKQ
jgi:hypothetical protein